MVDGSFHEKELTSFALEVTDNPSLRRAYSASIDQSLNTIHLDVPNYVDAKSMTVHFEYRGHQASIDGKELLAERSTVDLSSNAILEVQGLDGETRTYRLLVKRTPPDTHNELVDISFFWNVWDSDGQLLHDTALWCKRTELPVDHLEFRKFSGGWEPRTHIYVTLTIVGLGVSSGGIPLGAGRSHYYSSNWLDFTNPVEITITAEDLSTRVYTIILVDGP